MRFTSLPSASVAVRAAFPQWPSVARLLPYLRPPGQKAGASSQLRAVAGWVGSARGPDAGQEKAVASGHFGIPPLPSRGRRPV